MCEAGRMLPPGGVCACLRGPCVRGCPAELHGHPTGPPGCLLQGEEEGPHLAGLPW